MNVNNDIIKLENYAYADKGKIDNSKELFKLESIYKNHNKVTDEIIRKAIIYNDSYTKELSSLSEELFSSINIKELIFGSELTEEEFKDISLGKLRRDVLKQLGIYNYRSFF